MNKTAMRIPAGLAAGLALLTACATGPVARASLGPLELDNALAQPVAFTATWSDAEQGVDGVLEGLLPAGSVDIQVVSDAVPAGASFRFAIAGQGYDQLLAKHGMTDAATLPAVFQSEGVQVESLETAVLSRVLGPDLAQPEGPLVDAQLEWTYPGGELRMQVVADGAGGLRLARR